MAYAPNRRLCLAAMVATFAGGPGEVQARDMNLAQAAAGGGRFYGAAVRLDQLKAEDDLRAAVLRECSCLTPELELKWAAVEPAQGQLTLKTMDEFASFALVNGKELRGHTLLWHRSTPVWAEQLLRDSRDWTVIRRHFASIMPRYGEVISRWDVVNEPMETGHRADGLRNNVFLEVFGPDYIRAALEDARLIAPKAKLLINEFGLDYDIPLEKDRRYLFLKLLERLKKAGAPLDGVGMQAHLDLSKGPFSERVLAAFLAEIADMGLSITVTELDVKEVDYGRPPAERDQRVADAARRYLDVALAEPAVDGVISWGFTDRHSWLAAPPDLRGRPEEERLNRGLPFDAGLKSKPMREAMIAAFNHRTQTASAQAK